MKIVNTITTVPAPAWFQKVWEDIKPFEKQLAEIMGMDFGFVQRERIKMMEKGEITQEEIQKAAKKAYKNSKRPELSLKEKTKAEILTGIINSSMETSWLKFRLENIDEEWVGNNFKYDFINQTIVVEVNENEKTKT